MKLKKYIVTLLCAASASFLTAANPNDLDRDGEISWEEFKTLKKKQTAQNGSEYNEEQIKYIFQDKDRDGDGVLSYKEFGNHPVDLDGDKSISYKEYVQMHKTRAKRNDRDAPKEAWIKNLFAKKDSNGDGELSYKELAKPVK